MGREEKTDLIPKKTFIIVLKTVVVGDSRGLTDLRYVGRGWDGEGVSIESEGDIYEVKANTNHTKDMQFMNLVSMESSK